MRCTVTYRREDGWWLAAVQGIRGCHTQGRTIDEARRRIREALGLFIRNADSAELVDDVRLPREARESLAAQRRTNRRLEDVQASAREANRRAVRDLLGMGLSLRDVGRLLGLSFQRVQQISRELEG